MGETEEKNYYELLGVSRNASTHEIKTAFKELARVFHPDSRFFDEIVGDQKRLEENQLFHLITDAYNTLIDHDKRTTYDEGLPPEIRTWSEPAKDAVAKELNRAMDGESRHTEVSARGVFGRVEPADEDNQAVVKGVLEMGDDLGLLDRVKYHLSGLLDRFLHRGGGFESQGR
jgi:DnaJ-class molecular chaperone